MRTIRLQIAATETHCEHNGLCDFLEFDPKRHTGIVFGFQV